jgi:hypothetical protein
MSGHYTVEFPQVYRILDTDITSPLYKHRSYSSSIRHPVERGLRHFRESISSIYQFLDLALWTPLIIIMMRVATIMKTRYAEGLLRRSITRTAFLVSVIQDAHWTDPSALPVHCSLYSWASMSNDIFCMAGSSILLASVAAAAFAFAACPWAWRDQLLGHHYTCMGGAHRIGDNAGF